MLSSSPVSQQPPAVLHQWHEMYQAFVHAPRYHLIFEAFLALWIIKLLFVRSYRLKLTKSKDGSGTGGGGLTEKEKEELIREWVPEPLVPPSRPCSSSGSRAEQSESLVRSFDRQYLTLHRNGNENDDQLTLLLDLTSYNFLGMVGRQLIADSCSATLHKYGVGACGPRGFYGTIDVHLDLEGALARFCGTQEACVYSYGLATASSIIPAFAKRGDIIFADEAVNFGIQKGLQASRSLIKTFRHNDTIHLEQLLEQQAALELKDPAKARVTKKFIVVEGLYQYTGEICPLPQIVEFRKRFKTRVFVEESLSFGVLGDTGRGVTEHYGIAVTEVDLVIGSLENSLGSMGGFCAGKKYIIENNYLSGLGYCFSASLPPIQATAALTALEFLEGHPGILKDLKCNARRFRCSLTEALGGKTYRVSNEEIGFKLTGSSSSPLLYLTAQPDNPSIGAKPAFLEELKSKMIKVTWHLCHHDSIYVRVPVYLYKEEMNPARLAPASLKICLKAGMDEPEVDACAEAICTTVKKIFGHQKDGC